MYCPSCKHEQSGSVECERCGVIFEKYRKRQERLALESSASAESSEPQQKKALPGWLLALVVGIISGGGTFYYLNSTADKAPLPVSPSATAPVIEHQAVAKAVEPSPKQAAAVNSRNGKTTELEGLALQLSGKYAVNSGIDAARNATVFIQTSWGSGSGFFVSPNGLIVTNKHVLKMKDKDVQKLTAQITKGTKLLTREEKNLQYLKNKVAKVRDNELRQRVWEDIREREKNLRKYRRAVEELQQKVSVIDNASPIKGVKVTLVDGSEYNVDSVMMSSRFDLALLSINVWSAPYLVPSKRHGKQGQQVYAVGNPQGLRHSVTSGIISGYRTFDGIALVQTDAPINPGNSGGPLIDENGGVVGVNTMIFRNTEGIGFAIPMKTVWEEYGNYMSRE